MLWVFYPHSWSRVLFWHRLLGVYVCASVCVCVRLSLYLSPPRAFLFFRLFHLYPSNSSSISFISFPLIPHSYLVSAAFYIRFHSVKAKEPTTVFSSTSLFPYILSCFSFFKFWVTDTQTQSHVAYKASDLTQPAGWRISHDSSWWSRCGVITDNL